MRKCKKETTVEIKKKSNINESINTVNDTFIKIICG